MATKKNAVKQVPKAAAGASQVAAGKRYVSTGIAVESSASDCSRADIIFDGVEHSGPSYEGRVFLNNPKADETTAQTDAEGYAGTFHIFGHGWCFGDDPSHCEVRKAPRPYDPRPSHSLTPAQKVVIATDAVKAALGKGKALTVTVVPVVRPESPKTDYADVLKFDKVTIVTYR